MVTSSHVSSTTWRTPCELRTTIWWQPEVPPPHRHFRFRFTRPCRLIRQPVAHAQINPMQAVNIIPQVHFSAGTDINNNNTQFLKPVFAPVVPSMATMTGALQVFPAGLPAAEYALVILISLSREFSPYTRVRQRVPVLFPTQIKPFL